MGKTTCLKSDAVLVDKNILQGEVPQGHQIFNTVLSFAAYTVPLTLPTRWVTLHSNPTEELRKAKERRKCFWPIPDILDRAVVEVLLRSRHRNNNQSKGDWVRREIWNGCHFTPKDKEFLEEL